MPKRQKHLQDMEMDSYKKTYGECNLTLSVHEPNKKGKVVENKVSFDTISMARLTDPTKYQYKQKYRLYRNATEAAKICLDKVSQIMNRLPDSYKEEITTSGGFYQFNRSTLESLNIQEQKGKDSNPVAFNHYSQMLIYGLQGIIESMPLDFRQLLTRQLEPFLTTMQSISSFAKHNNPKSWVPYFTVPYDLLPLH